MVNFRVGDLDSPFSQLAEQASPSTQNGEAAPPATSPGSGIPMAAELNSGSLSLLSSKRTPPPTAEIKDHRPISGLRTLLG